MQLFFYTLTNCSSVLVVHCHCYAKTSGWRVEENECLHELAHVVQSAIHAHDVALADPVFALCAVHGDAGLLVVGENLSVDAAVVASG